jgi:1-aminocyclopropane-1-carboxylate deaminase
MMDYLTINLSHIQWLSATGSNAFCTVARLDELHPFVSGNKFFKLKYNLQAAASLKKGIITMGGAYSNHLAATAFACREAGIPSIGLIRGEILKPLNHTLAFCRHHNMQLLSVPRNEYKSHSLYIKELQTSHPDYFFVPEGGSNAEGEKGCSEIAALIPHFHSFTHIACAVGTGTTERGLLQSMQPHQTMLAVPVLKIKEEERSLFMQQHLSSNTHQKIKVLFDYAGKGYAKKEEHIFSFMNQFYEQTKLPLDFVYTAKLLMAADDLFCKHYFTKDDRLLIVHTGGLQGNDSLPAGTIRY